MLHQPDGVWGQRTISTRRAGRSHVIWRPGWLYRKSLIRHLRRDPRRPALPRDRPEDPRHPSQCGLPARGPHRHRPVSELRSSIYFEPGAHARRGSLSPNSQQNSVRRPPEFTSKNDQESPRFLSTQIGPINRRIIGPRPFNRKITKNTEKSPIRGQAENSPKVLLDRHLCRFRMASHFSVPRFVSLFFDWESGPILGHRPGGQRPPICLGFAQEPRATRTGLGKRCGSNRIPELGTLTFGS